MWILFTLLAAFMQSWRNALQSQLSRNATVLAVTFARFIIAPPLAGMYCYALYLWQPAAAPNITIAASMYVTGAAIMQIVATALMVVLFKQKNYAVGVGLAKSEAIIAAILGVVFFGTALTLLGWVGVVIGAIAVWMLSGIKAGFNFSRHTMVLGLASGGAFALTSLWVREASLLLALPTLHSAAWTLLFVVTIQVAILFIYLSFSASGVLRELVKHNVLTLLIGVSGFIGSVGWFTAMSLESVAYVKTVGQVEVVFTLLISLFWLKEKPKWADIAGLFLIIMAAILVIWA